MTFEAIDTKTMGTTQTLELELELPQTTQAQLAQTSLCRLLYAVHLQRLSGTLTLSHGNQHKRYAILQGALIEGAPGHTGSAESLISAFAWSTGEFSLQVHGEKPLGQRHLLMPLIQRGIETRVSSNSLFKAVMPSMPLYPVVTQLWAERRDQSQWPLLHELLEQCSGKSSLEQILSRFGVQAASAFQATWFARETDLLVFQPQKSLQTITIVYKKPKNSAVHISSTSASQIREDRSTSAPASSESPEVSSETQSQIEALRTMHAQMQEKSAHEVLELEQGCGSKAVQQKYYELVKKYHPDTYGDQNSDALRKLAQDIFICIQNAYMEALKWEKNPPKPTTQTSGKTPTTSSEKSASSESSTPPPTSVSPPNTPASKTISPPNTQKAEPQTSPDSSAQNKPATSPSSAVPPRERQKLKSPAQACFNEGYKLFRANRFDEALELLEKAHEKEPDNTLFMTFYAYTLFVLSPDKMNESEDLLKRAIDAPQSQALPHAHLFMGHLYKSQEKHKRALWHYRQCLELNPKSIEAQREIRLYEMRKPESTAQGKAGFFKKLFKK